MFNLHQKIVPSKNMIKSIFTNSKETKHDFLIVLLYIGRGMPNNATSLQIPLEKLKFLPKNEKEN